MSFDRSPSECLNHSASPDIAAVVRMLLTNDASLGTYKTFLREN
jgi:hypothetical protein